MGRRLSRSFAVLALALLLAVLVGIARSDAQDQPRLVRLSFSSGWDALPAVVAIERGFLAQEGVIASSLAVSSAEAVINSLAAGSTDFAVVPQRTFLVMVAAKAPIKVIGMSGWGTDMELVVKKGSPIKGVADLKGKKVAITQGSEAFPILIRLLNQAKLKPGDVKITQITGDQLTQVFVKNTADAVFETRHFTGALVKTGGAVVAVKPEDVTKTVGTITGRPLVAGNKVIEKESDTVQRVVNAWIKALTYIQQDPKDSARLLRIFFHRQGVTITDEMATAWVGATKYDLYMWTKEAIADAEYNAWGLKTGKILKVAPKLDGFVENRFVIAASKALNGS